MDKEANKAKEHSTLRIRRTVTPAKLAANRANARKPGTGRPPGSMSPIKRDLAERCRVNDARHVEILESIAENSPNEGFKLTAIRDLFDRGHGRPRQGVDGQISGGVTINICSGVETPPDWGNWSTGSDEQPLAIEHEPADKPGH